MKNVAFRVAFFFAMTASWVYGADTATHLTPPKSGTIKVAFLLSEGATVIDFAGPWDVFETVMLGDDRNTEESHPFELYTVAPSKAPIHTSGSHRPGFTVVPDYDFTDAPVPDIVVIPAQAGGPGMTEWLQKVHAQNRIIMSVCTGAFKLAKTGLLDGKQATTHHWFFDKFSKQYPNVQLVRAVRYVQVGPVVFTAGGETSGIDLALHIVADYFGTQAAQRTADSMEYQGVGWKTNIGVSEADVPVTHEEWHGDIGPGRTVRLHIAMQGATSTETADAPWQQVTGAPAMLGSKGNKVDITFEFAGHAATFAGTDNDADDTLTGVYTQDGKSYPLTLVKDRHMRP